GLVAAHHRAGDRSGRRADARFLKKPRAPTILGAVTNPLQIKNLVRGAGWVIAAATAGCGGRQHADALAPTTPLPTAGLAAQQVSVLPLPLLAAEDSLHWQALLADRRAALAPGCRGTACRAPTMPVAPVATAELSVVMVDVRTGRVGFRTVARGDGDDPWSALARAVKSLTPGLP